MGGTGANHIMLGTGDAIWYSDGNGNPPMPPHNWYIAAGSPNAGIVDEIENPEPLPGTNNWYTEDGYGGGSYGSPSPAAAATATAPTPTPARRQAVVTICSRCPTRSSPIAHAGHYYLLNNYNPGYFGDGSSAYADIGNPGNTVFTIPPPRVRNIGDALMEKNISFDYYGDQWNAYLANPYNNYVTAGQHLLQHLRLLPVLHLDHDQPARAHGDISDTPTSTGHPNGTLPAVSFVKPSGYARRPPGLLEAGSLRRLRQENRRPGPGQPELWAAPRSWSRSTKAAATTIPATCSRSTSSATAPASR